MEKFICQHIGCQKTFKGRQQRWIHGKSCTFPKGSKYDVQDGKLSFCVWKVVSVCVAEEGCMDGNGHNSETRRVIFGVPLYDT